MSWSCVTSWSSLCGVPLDGSLGVLVPWAVRRVRICRRSWTVRIRVWDASGADTYPAPDAHPQIRIRWWATDAWIPPPDRPRPVAASGVATTSLRVRACPAVPSGCGRGWCASARAMNTSIPRIGTSPHSSPAMSREPRLYRARSSVAPPFSR